MNTKQKKEFLWRMGIYTVGMIILALGLTLNTKTGLGVSPVISIPFTISAIWGTNFGMTTFVIYFVFVGIQLALKGIKGKILLQIPTCYVFSMLLNVFSDCLDFSYDQLWQNLLLLLAAMMVTAVGIIMVVNMKLVPNPADGLTQVLGEALKRGVGFGKNVMDVTCVALSLVIGLIAAGKVPAIGIGTAIAMIGVGRFVALFNHFAKDKMEQAAGLAEETQSLKQKETSDK